MAVTKVIELVGSSSESWEDAARNAVSGAAKSLHGITKIQVVDWSARVSDGEIAQYDVMVKLSFVVD